MEGDFNPTLKSETNKEVVDNVAINRYDGFIKLFVVIFLIILTTSILNSSFFDIKEVVVTNNITFTTEEIIMLSGIKQGQSIYRVNKNRIKQLLEDNPRIGQVEVKVKFPNKLIINVFERNPLCLIPYRGNYLVMAKDKVIMTVVPRRSSVKLPLVVGMNPDQPLIGVSLKCDKIDEVTEVLRNVDQKLFNVLVQIDIGNYLLYVRNQSTSQIIKVELGNMQQIQKKIVNLHSVLIQMNLQEIMTIDMRKPNMPNVIKK